ncbi:MAG: hypothetical protein K2H43_04885, partial [Clostridia bacterium]|nr:hypothetical protein [Clostridia bacterium]
MNSLGRGDDKKEKNKASVMTRETIGMTILLFGALVFFIAVTSPYVFGDPGAAITAFFLGLFGIFFYPLDILLIYWGFVLVSGKKLIPAKWILRVGLVVLSVFLIVHLATSERFLSQGYCGYMSGCWTDASNGAGGGTGGGVCMGIVVFPLRSLLQAAGAYVVFALFTAAALFFLLMGTPVKGMLFRSRTRGGDAGERGEVRKAPVTFEELSAPAYHETPPEPIPEERYRRPQPVPAARRSAQKESREILFSGDPASSYRNNLIFSSDSQFNNSARKSSVERKSAAPAADGGSDAKVYEYGAPKPVSVPSYSERYSTQAETARPAMPRKVVPAERTFPAREENYNYPPTPTYRAPAPDSGEKRDFYSNDVPVRGQEAPQQPARQPESNVEEGYGFRPLRRSAPAEPAASETPAVSAEPAPENEARSSRDLFRSAFSRSSEQTQQDEPRFGFGSRAVSEPVSKPVPEPEEEIPESDRLARAFRDLDAARGQSAAVESLSAAQPAEQPAEEPAPEISRRGFTEPEPIEEQPEPPRRVFEEPAEEFDRDRR